MRALTCSLLCLATNAFAAPIDPPGAPDGERLKGHVLVWHDAPLLAEPDEGARPLALATLSAPRKERVGHVVALKVVAAKGAFVEVELTGDEDCTASRALVPDDLARVRMFVRRSDLAPVLVKPFAQTFPDGTSITLGVGTPVVPTDAGTFVVSLRGDTLEVALPAASIGHAYVPAKTSNSMDAGQTVAIAPRTRARLGDHSVALTAWTGAPVERRGEMAIVALEDRCMTARVAVPAKALTEVDESSLDMGGGGGSGMSLRDEYFIPRLAPLMIGTRVVAVAARPIYLHAAPMGKHACIQRAIRLHSALAVDATGDKLRLCAPASKVVRERMRSARSAHGTTRR